MKKIKLSLLTKVIIAIILGLLIGKISPEFLVRSFSTFGSIFSNFLGFTVPLIIVGLVISGIADLGKGAGKLLLFTVILAYTSTLFSGFLTFFTFSNILPLVIDSSQTGLLLAAKKSTTNLSPYFNLVMTPVFDVMTALVLSFILGIGISATNSEVIKNAAFEFKNVVEKLISSVIIPILPVYIFGIFLNMSYTGEAFEIIQIFGKVIALIFLLTVVLLLLQFIAAGLASKKNPLRLLKTMLPAYATALGTSSSAATIPVTLNQTKKNGVNEDIADFVIPLCATIHLGGSTMKITAMSMAIILLQGQTLDLPTFIGFIFMLGITMVAAPGVPGGAIMAAIAILQSILGFNEQATALMIAVYIAIDSFGTATNVTGDGALAVIVDKFNKRLK